MRGTGSPRRKPPLEELVRRERCVKSPTPRQVGPAIRSNCEGTAVRVDAAEMQVRRWSRAGESGGLRSGSRNPHAQRAGRIGRSGRGKLEHSPSRATSSRLARAHDRSSVATGEIEMGRHAPPGRAVRTRSAARDRGRNGTDRQPRRARAAASLEPSDGVRLCRTHTGVLRCNSPSSACRWTSSRAGRRLHAAFARAHEDQSGRCLLTAPARALYRTRLAL